MLCNMAKLCNDYKPLQEVVSSGSKGGNHQRILGVVISGLSLVSISLVRCGEGE